MGPRSFFCKNKCCQCLNSWRPLANLIDFVTAGGYLSLFYSVTNIGYGLKRFRFPFGIWNLRIILWKGRNDSNSHKTYVAGHSNFLSFFGTIKQLAHTLRSIYLIYFVSRVIDIKRADAKRIVKLLFYFSVILWKRIWESKWPVHLLESYVLKNDNVPWLCLLCGLVNTHILRTSWNVWSAKRTLFNIYDVMNTSQTL